MGTGKGLLDSLMGDIGVVRSDRKVVIMQLNFMAIPTSLFI